MYLYLSIRTFKMCLTLSQKCALAQEIDLVHQTVSPCESVLGQDYNLNHTMYTL